VTPAVAGALARTIALATATALIGALVVAAGTPASALYAGPLASVVNANVPTSTSGTNLDAVRVTAPSACNSAATRHVAKIVAASATDPADQVAASAWVGDTLYYASQYGLPGPVTVRFSSWQQLATSKGQQIVPGRYEFVLRCQESEFLGSIVEQWSGGVIFSSPTAWSAISPAPPRAVPTTTLLTAAPAETDWPPTLIATVSGDDSSPPTGSVEFFDGTASLGSIDLDASGAARWGHRLFVAGTHAITGVYSGDHTFQSSTGTVSVDVTQAVFRTRTTLSVDPPSGPAYQAVTLGGHVIDYDAPGAAAPLGSCTFFDGAATVGTAPVGADRSCTMTSSAFAPGDHQFAIVFTPTDPLQYEPSTSEAKAATYVDGGDGQTVVVTVPAGELSIFTPYTQTNPLDLGDMVLAADGSSFSATAEFREVTVTDTRAGNPGWTASLTRADFVGPDGSIPARFSGLVDLVPRYVVGNALTSIDVRDIPPNYPQSGPVAFAWTSEGAGTGTVGITADFVLEGVPTSTGPGRYTATVTFTVA